MRYGAKVPLERFVRFQFSTRLNMAITKLWPALGEFEGETHELQYLVDQGWCWNWPGWEWVAKSLNAIYGNGRSAAACRQKYNRITGG